MGVVKASAVACGFAERVSGRNSGNSRHFDRSG